MPVLLGVEYRDLPTENPGSTCYLYDYSDNMNPYKKGVNSAKNSTPLWNAVVNSLAEYGIEGRAKELIRDTEYTFPLDYIQSQAGTYDIYVQGYINYTQTMLDYLDAAYVHPNTPQNNFAAFFMNNYNQNFQSSGSCGYTRKYIKNVTRPWVQLQMDQLKQAQNQFDWVREAIEGHLEGLVANATLAGDVEEAYGRYLDQKAENEAAERAIVRAQTLENVSQLALVGAGVLVAASELKIIK